MIVPPAQVRSLIEAATSGQVTPDVTMSAQIATVMGTGGELQHTELIKKRDWLKDPKFYYLAQLDVRKDVSQEHKDTEPTDVRTALTSAQMLNQAADIVEDALLMKLAHSMPMAPEVIDSTRPVTAYGVDFLVSMEIRNWIEGTLSSNAAFFDILNSGSIEKLAAKIAENSGLVLEKVRLQKLENGA